MLSVWRFHKTDDHIRRNCLRTPNEFWVSIEHCTLLGWKPPNFPLIHLKSTFPQKNINNFYSFHFLAKIRGGQLVGEITEFAQKVRQLEQEEKDNQEALVDPPDEFLDPIMSTLMCDPVILPSSHVTVDRTTISRHLLSDQTDPFNRAPLTMDQVQPDEELKAKIQAWIAERRRERAENEAANA